MACGPEQINCSGCLGEGEFDSKSQVGRRGSSAGVSMPLLKCCTKTTNCCRKKSMLRLHHTHSDLILSGLGGEINEYARYANEGNHNEHTLWYGCGDSNARRADIRLLGNEELSIRPRRSMWSMQRSGKQRDRCGALPNLSFGRHLLRSRGVLQR